MPRSISIEPEFAAADLRRAERWQAVMQGRVDGRLGTHCPLPSHVRALAAHRSPEPFRPQLASSGETAWTAFIASAHRTADVTSAEMTNWLMNRNRNLVVKVHRSAGVLVQEFVEHGWAADGAPGRFLGALTEWRAKVHEARSAAVAAGRRADAMVSVYWTALVRSHARRHPDAYRCQRLRPPNYELDPIWVKPDQFLLLSYAPVGVEDETTARARRTMERAIEILAYLADREPGHRPGQELL